MENRKATEAGQDVTMQKEDFAALWKTIHLKVTDTYEVPPEILWVNGSTIGTLGNFSASTGKDLNGTARVVGMGGAMGALGGDISTMGTILIIDHSLIILGLTQVIQLILSQLVEVGLMRIGHHIMYWLM